MDHSGPQSQFTYQAQMQQPNPFSGQPLTTENRTPRPKACTTCRSSKHRCDGQEGVLACSRCVRNLREVCAFHDICMIPCVKAPYLLSSPCLVLVFEAVTTDYTRTIIFSYMSPLASLYPILWLSTPSISFNHMPASCSVRGQSVNRWGESLRTSSERLLKPISNCPPRQVLILPRLPRHLQLLPPRNHNQLSVPRTFLCLRSVFPNHLSPNLLYIIKGVGTLNLNRQLALQQRARISILKSSHLLGTFNPR